MTRIVLPRTHVFADEFRAWLVKRGHHVEVTGLECFVDGLNIEHRWPFTYDRIRVLRNAFYAETGREDFISPNLITDFRRRSALLHTA